MSTATTHSPEISTSEWTHTLLDALPDQIYTKDLEGRFVWVNAATAKFFNLPPDALIGRTDFDFFPAGLAEQFHAEEQELIHSGKGFINREAHITDAEGHPQWIITSKVALRSGLGDSVGVAGINRVITDRKVADEQLRLQVTALNAAAIGVVMTDRTGAILWVNPGFTQMTGYSLEEVIGRNPRLLKSGRQDPAVYQRLWETILGGQVWRSEITNRRKDGTFYDIEAVITPVRDTTGTITNFVAVHQDITARKQSERKLLQLNEDMARSQIELLEVYDHLKNTQSKLIQAEKLESIGRLSAGIAHEVKNPLAILLMGVGYFEDSLPAEPPEAGTVLNDMRDAVERADAIVRELLDFASPRELETTVEELNSVVTRSLRLVQHEFNVRHITVVREFADHLPSRRIDRIRIEQVFVNLFMNACQAMSKGGTLTVRTFTRDEAVVVEVLDTGAGIPEAALAKVFDPFFTTKPLGVGTGMGLAVAKQILLQHTGDLELTNRPTGGVQATVIFHNGKESHDEAD